MDVSHTEKPVGAIALDSHLTEEAGHSDDSKPVSSLRTRQQRHGECI